MSNSKNYEDQLGDALELVLGSGAQDATELAEGLNKLNFTGEEGARWTAEVLEKELKRLAPAEWAV